MWVVGGGLLIWLAMFGEWSWRDLPALPPEVILLPDEPYAFGAHDVTELRQLPVPAARDGRIHLIDGTLVSWYGPRIGRAIEALGRLLAP